MDKAPQALDVASVVLLWADDSVLADELARGLVRRNAGLELQVVRNVEILVQHAKRVQPDAVIIDLDSLPVAAVSGLLGAGELDRTKILTLARNPDAIAERLDTSIECVTRDDEYVRKIAAQLLDARAALELDPRIEETVKHYRDILDASSDGIFVLVAGVFTYVNKAFTAAVGYPAEEIIGLRALTDLTVEGDRLMFGEELARLAVVDGKRDLFEIALICGDGGERRFEISCRSSVVDGRRAVVGVARDVTAVRELQEEISRARQRVVQVERLQALGELAAGVAHDFNNALETILGRIQLARDKVKRGMSVEEDLDIIESAGRTGAVTVQRVQDFARSGGSDSWHDVDPAAVVQDASNFVRTRVPEDVTLEVEIEPAPVIRGNGGELREALLNLLGNALEAVGGRGRVALRCFSKGSHAVVEVEDNGRGMPPEVRNRAFEPFFTTKGNRGIGLGLSVSHGILRRHDAEIELDSELGRGTRFRITFVPATERAAPRRVIDTSAMSIVVVDDDSAVAELMKDLLEELGHTVTLLENQTDTLAFVADHPVDLLITDLDLPGTSGWQLARSVRRIVPEALVGLMTGWPLGAKDEELKSRGVDFVLSKPFSMDALESALARLRNG
jgi:PAS domain S-box-containing protein